MLQHRHRRHHRQRRRRHHDGQEEGQQDVPSPHDQPLLLGFQLPGSNSLGYSCGIFNERLAH